MLTAPVKEHLKAKNEPIPRARDVKPFGIKFAAMLMLMDGAEHADVAEKYDTAVCNVRNWEREMAPMIEFITGLKRDIQTLANKRDTRLETVELVFKAMPASEMRSMVLGKMVESLLEKGKA